MESWHDQFQKMKEQFIARSTDRLKTIDALIDDLEKKPANEDALRQLRQHFHWLSGTGGTYRLDDVSKMGAYGEEGCDYFLNKNVAVGPSDLDRFRNLIQGVRDAFSGQTVSIEPEPKTTAAPVDARPQILVVDSDQGSNVAVERLLTDESMKAIGVKTIAQARKALDERLPDGLIISVPLRDGNAYDLIEHCRSLPGGNRTAIVVVSKQKEFIDRVNAIHAGADAFFEHPADLKIMVQKMRDVLKKDKPALYRILHVEDDPDQATFIKAALESAGYNVVSLSDPDKFEEWLLAVQPDLVILDVMLGRITGFDLARYMRQDDSYSTVPILFLTTQNQLNAHVESALAGGDDHMVKPIAPPLLCATVAGRLERARAVKQLMEKDGLTGALNHSAFMKRAQFLLEASNGNRLAMLVLNIDNLRAINEEHGYEAGDRVLSRLSRLLSQRCRSTDTIGRLGGDQFAVIIEGIDDSELASLAGLILSEFEKTRHKSEKQWFHATFSAGACTYEPGLRFDRWLQLAEQAMMAAKSGGRNRVMKTRAAAR